MLIHFIHITTLWSEEHTLFAPLKGMENLRVWCHLLCCARGHVWVLLKKLLSISPRSVQPRVSAFGFCQGFILLWFYIIVLLVSRVLFFATRWTEAYQAPLSVEFSRQEYWSGLPFPSPGDLPDPGIAPASPALQADSLPLCHLGSLLIWYYGANNTDFTGLCVLSLSRLGEEFYNML